MQGVIKAKSEIKSPAFNILNAREKPRNEFSDERLQY